LFLSDHYYSGGALQYSTDRSVWLLVVHILVLSENPAWWGTNVSILNLAIITIDRYLKVVHPTWSRKYLRTWVIYSAAALAWFLGTVYNTVLVFTTTAVIDGYCYGYLIYGGDLQSKVYAIWYFVSFYVIILVIFIFCYGRILVAIRRQASVMASHNASGPSAAQAQAHSNQIQSNVIKTMIIVSVFFAIAFLPSNVYFLFVMLDKNLPVVDSYYYLTKFLAFCYISANPFIYATKFNPVRKVLREMIPCKKIPVQPYL